MSSKTCYILVGPSGAGKSTAIESLGGSLPSTAVFSLDAVRLTATPGISGLDPKTAYARAFQWATSNPTEFDAAVNAVWRATLKYDTVFVDNTNLTRKSRARWIAEARQAGFRIVGVEFYVPLEQIIARQSTRADKSVPENVVRDMYYRQQSLLVGDEVDQVIAWDSSSR